MTDTITLSEYLRKNGYHFGKVIGEGSYSKVRSCTKRFRDGRPAFTLACKIINKKVASADFVYKFLPREVAIVNKLVHPNIVRCYDTVEVNDTVYIFMDICEKGDLLEYVKLNGYIPENRCRQYFGQLLSAVRFLHKKDVAHRDLKCENILLGNHDQIKISDFGFARSCRDGKGKKVLSNTYCGSAAYAAPEIIQGTSYNPKLYDVWSLGCILFIILTGNMPFDESDINRMLKQQMDRILIYPDYIQDKISNEVKHLISRLLEPDVTRRATLDQIFAHPWIKGHPRPAPGPVSTFRYPPVMFHGGDGQSTSYASSVDRGRPRHNGQHNRGRIQPGVRQSAYFPETNPYEGDTQSQNLQAQQSSGRRFIPSIVNRGTEGHRLERPVTSRRNTNPTFREAPTTAEVQQSSLDRPIPKRSENHYNSRSFFSRRSPAFSKRTEDDRPHSPDVVHKK